MTNKELSSAVRAILKENGYKTSDFSISTIPKPPIPK